MAWQSVGSYTLASFDAKENKIIKYLFIIYDYYIL